MTGKRILAIATLLLLAVAGGVYFEFQRNATPTVRTDVSTPVYSLGELQSYDSALSDGRVVVKFGPMFLGLYPGGQAFTTVEAAASYMSQNDWDPAAWGIYELSGDFLLDVSGGYTNKSLIVRPKTQGILAIGQAPENLLMFGPIGISKADILTYGFETDTPSVQIRLSEEKAQELAAYTKSSVGTQMNIRLIGQLVRIIHIAEAITGGEIRLSLDKEHSATLKQRLASGDD
ncbi:hypothetical protein [Ruegeria sp. EL01]|jgi:hypothetical protein|uniref:hypothetical protein n=1 Tax=Ruegeria sp. EL01 TaxID=2107578 RepID=UPI000EA82AFA|nr:hypothetical protein [Ruegeria sp. EL01]